MNKSIKSTSESWLKLVEKIPTTFKPGEIITHENMLKLFKLKEPLEKDYTSFKDLKDALKKFSFQYMFLVDSLRSSLLINEKFYLINIYGEGYSLLYSNEQADYAINKVNQEVTRSFNKSLAIAKNIRTDKLSFEDKQHATDIYSKISHISQIVKKQFKKSEIDIDSFNITDKKLCPTG